MRGGCSAELRSSCRRGFRLQAEAFHLDAAWSAHGVGRSSPPHASAWAEWPGARFGCSLVYDLGQSARRAEIAERCVAPGPLTVAWGLSRGSSDHRVVVASAFRRKHSVASTQDVHDILLFIVRVVASAFRRKHFTARRGPHMAPA